MEELEAPWDEILLHIRTIATADSSIAHLFGFHHLLIATVALFGNKVQEESFFVPTIQKNWFWGNALNPLDPGTIATPSQKGYTINGKKSFCSGSVDADALVISASDSSNNGKLLVGVIPLPYKRAGIDVRKNWEAFGQRQTDSGSVLFNEVELYDQEILRTPGPLGDIRATLRPLIAQLIFANIYIGLAEGAYKAALPIARSATTSWPASGVDHAQDDPYLLHRHGEIKLSLRSATLLTEHAGRSLQHAWSKGRKISKAERGSVAIDITIAKIASTRVALDITSKVFDLVGARAAISKENLDRFWRNARLLTLHDPVDYKVREIGSHAFLGTFPQPSFYS